MGRFALAAIALALGGCQKDLAVHEPKPLAGSSLTAMPKRGIAEIGRQPICLYWLDEKVGSYWRCSMDGIRKELVIDCKLHRGGKLVSRTSFSTSRAGPGSYLALSNVPAGSGYAIVDGPPKNVEGKSVPFAKGPHDMTVPAPFTYSSKPSPWTVEFDVEPVVATDHHHFYLHRIAFSKPQATPKVYGFSTREGGLVGVLDCDAAVLFDPPDIVLWTLNNDKKYLLAKGNRPALWPRDLSKPERIAPTAVYERDRVKFKWKMKTPQDLYPEKHRPSSVVKNLK